LRLPLNVKLNVKKVDPIPAIESTISIFAMINIKKRLFQDFENKKMLYSGG